MLVYSYHGVLFSCSLTRYLVDQSNPESIEDLVELVVPELQKRGIYWNDYPVPGGTLRENMQNNPGQPLAAPDHPAAKLRWDKFHAKATNDVSDTKVDAASEDLGKVEISKASDVSVSVEPVLVTAN